MDGHPHIKRRANGNRGTLWSTRLVKTKGLCSNATFCSAGSATVRSLGHFPSALFNVCGGIVRFVVARNASAGGAARGSVRAGSFGESLATSECAATGSSDHHQ